MKNTDVYQCMQMWQEKHKIYFGDKVRFIFDSCLYEGFLTGFDIESVPIKPIVRYVNHKGNSRIVALRSDAILLKMNQSLVN